VPSAFGGSFTTRLIVLRRVGKSLRYRARDATITAGAAGRPATFVAADINRDGLTDLVQLDNGGGVRIDWQLPNKQIVVDHGH
jgi:hypothetical protein